MIGSIGAIDSPLFRLWNDTGWTDGVASSCPRSHFREFSGRDEFGIQRQLARVGHERVSECSWRRVTKAGVSGNELLTRARSARESSVADRVKTIKSPKSHSVLRCNLRCSKLSFFKTQFTAASNVWRLILSSTDLPLDGLFCR